MMNMAATDRAALHLLQTFHMYLSFLVKQAQSMDMRMVG